MSTVRPLLLLAALMFPACAQLPAIRPADPQVIAQQTAACTHIFPQGRWQFTHAIEFRPPDGSRQTLLGVVQISSRERTFQCVMMTIEGLVLIEATYDGDITVKRAVPPLDRPGVAQGMVQDIYLIFFAPDQPCTASGPSENDTWICRFPSEEGGMEDIVLWPDGAWEIRRYSASHRLLRTVAPMTAEDDIQPGEPPTRVVLDAPGVLGYRLEMRLLEAIPLNRKADTDAP